MSDDDKATTTTPEDIDGDAVEMSEAAAEVEDYLPASSDLVLRDPLDAHEAAIVLDAHDERMVLERIQGAALKKWVYRLPTGETGLSVDGVQDVTQLLNWTGKCRIGLDKDTLVMERTVEDGEELWTATIFATDAVTGQSWPGAASQPVRMQLKPDTAAKWRDKGRKVGDDDTVFDIFARTKAIQKAARNACKAFIPEKIEQTILALYTGQSARVEQIRTQAQAQIEDLPAPLDDERARELKARARATYERIGELDGGRLKVTPGMFHSYMTRAEHSHDRLEEFIAYLEERETQIPGEVRAEREMAQARDTANDVPCPVCEASRRRFCKGVRGAHPERIAARLEQIRKAAG